MSKNILKSGSKKERIKKEFIISTPHPPTEIQLLMMRCMQEADRRWGVGPIKMRPVEPVVAMSYDGQELIQAGDPPEVVIGFFQDAAGTLPFGNLFETPKEYAKLNLKYPHKCYNKCDRIINSYMAFIHAQKKYPEITIKQFKKWWKIPEIQFYCCMCHKKLNTGEII